MKYSEKSDQYALGCIAYELVTGHKLFNIPNPTLEAYWFHHAKVEPSAPTSANPGLPPYLEHAILTALAKDRKLRYPDVQAFCQTLLKTKEKGPPVGNTLHEVENARQNIYLNRDNALTCISKGDALYERQNYEKALAFYEQAIQFDSNNATAYNKKGHTLFFLNCYQEALAAYEQVIRLAPNHAPAYYHKGVILSELEYYQQALAAFDRAVQLDPNDALVYYKQGVALRALKRHKEAKEAFKKARQLGYKD